MFVVSELGTDAFAYWTVNLDALYEGTYGNRGFFPYSPVAALAGLPFALLPWPVFLAAWTAVLLAALVWLTGRRFLIFLAFPPVAHELVMGNITLLLTVALVLSLRWPAAWAVLLLTKVTPGIGLVWFAVRREWRYLGIALGASIAVILATFVILPAQWLDWFRLLSAGAPDVSVVPLWPRIPIALAVVVWGALTNRRWTIIAAATLVLPRMGMAELSMLVGIYALHRQEHAADNRPVSAAPTGSPARA